MYITSVVSRDGLRLPRDIRLSLRVKWLIYVLQNPCTSIQLELYPVQLYSGVHDFKIRL